MSDTNKIKGGQFLVSDLEASQIFTPEEFNIELTMA